MDAPGGWIGEGGVQLPASARRQLAVEEARDLAEERAAAAKRDADTERRAQLAYQHAVTLGRVAPDRSLAEVLREDGIGTTPADVLEHAQLMADRDDRREQAQAWREGTTQVEVLHPPTRLAPQPPSRFRPGARRSASS